MAENENAEAIYEPLSFVMPATPQDLILHEIALKLETPPVDEEGNALGLEVVLAAGDSPSSSTLEQLGDSFIAASSVAAGSSPQLRLQVRVAGFQTPLFDASLTEMTGAGLAGRILDCDVPAYAGESEEEGYAAPAGTASLSCSWRLQRTLPPVLPYLKRCQPLAQKYAAPSHREQFASRLDQWCLEMDEVVNKPPNKWSQPWLPPYPPHHLLGDPLTQQRRGVAAQAEVELQTQLRAQAVNVRLQTLKEQLPSCVTAQQAVRVLEAIRTFLESGDTMRQIDAPALLRSVRNLRLPFERLVRNVWQEGPEVVYDRSKAALEKLLQREVARRKGHATSAASVMAASASAVSLSVGGGSSLPALGNSTLGQSSSGEGVRLGLLTFHGKPVAKPVAKSIFD